VTCRESGSRVDRRTTPSRGDSDGVVGKLKVEERRMFERLKDCFVGDVGPCATAGLAMGSLGTGSFGTDVTSLGFLRTSSTCIAVAQ